MFVNRVCSRLPNRIRPLRIDSRRRVRQTAVSRQELAAPHRRWQSIGETLGILLAPHVGQVAAPPRVADRHQTAGVRSRDLQSGQIGDDAISHERPGPHGSVIGAGDRVANAGIDSPEPDRFGNGREALHLSRLA